MRRTECSLTGQHYCADFSPNVSNSSPELAILSSGKIWKYVALHSSGWPCQQIGLSRQLSKSIWCVIAADVTRLLTLFESSVAEISSRVYSNKHLWNNQQAFFFKLQKKTQKKSRGQNQFEFKYCNPHLRPWGWSWSTNSFDTDLIDTFPWKKPKVMQKNPYSIAERKLNLVFFNT